MLALAIIALLAAVALVSYAIHKINPTRVKLSAGVWKIVTFNFEADGGLDPSKELAAVPKDQDRA